MISLRNPDFSLGFLVRLKRRLPARNSDFGATPTLSPFAVHTDDSRANEPAIDRPDECGLNETAFNEICFDFAEKSRFSFGTSRKSFGLEG